MDRLSTLEIWSNLECNSGAKISDAPAVLQAVETAELAGEHKIKLQLDRRDTNWSNIAPERTLRATFVDASISEWKIREIEESRNDDNAMVGIVVADSVRHDLLQNAKLLRRVEKDGSVWTHFELYGMTPEQHVDAILKYAPSYFTKGTISPTERVDMIYHQDSPLSALEELATVTGYELEVVRNGSTDYLINLVEQRGSAATTVVIDHAGTLVSNRRTRRSADMGTVIFPRGGQEFGNEGSMANHAFLPASVVSQTITFTEDLFSEDDQLNGFYIMDNADPGVGGTDNIIEITDTIVPNQIVLASAPDLSGDGRVRFREQVVDPVAGTVYGALTYLPSPSGIQTYGTKPVILDRPDIPLIDNQLPNPFLWDTEWTGSVPDGYDALNGAVLSKNTNPLYTRHGGSSVKVVCTAVGQGIQTGLIDVVPTESLPYFVAQAQLWVEQGHVRLELVDETNSVVYPPVGSDAATLAVKTWIDNFGVAPGGDIDENFYTNGTQQFRIRLTQIGGEATTFYLDALMLAQISTFTEVFYGGRASNDLWLLAREGLSITTTPSEEYEVDLIDLHRLDPTTYSAKEIVLGGDVNLTDSDLGLDITTRIVSYEKNWLMEGETKIEVEEKSNDLDRVLGETERRIRRKLEPREGEGLPSDTVPEATCANLAGTDANYRQGGGVAHENVFDEYVYEPIPRGRTGLEVGDVVSFCVNLWVGAAGTTAPDTVNTTQDFGRTQSGLLWSMREDGHANMVGARTLNPTRPWLVNNGLGPSVIQKDGVWAFEFDTRENRYDAIVYNPPGATSYEIWTGNPPTGKEKLYVQANYQREGTDSPLAGGPDSVALTDSPAGRGYRSPNFYTTQPTISFTQTNIWTRPYAGVQMTCGSVYGGLWNGSAISILYNNGGTSYGSIGTFRAAGVPFRMFVSSTEQWFFTNANSGVIATEDAFDKNTWWVMLGCDNESGEHGANIDVGKVWWWDVMVMLDHTFRIEGLAEDDYVRVGSDARGWVYSFLPASAAGEADVWLNMANAFRDSPSNPYYGYGFPTGCPTYAGSCPITGTVEIYDGPAWLASSTMTDSIDIGDIEIYGGDTWVYDVTSTTIPGEDLTDVSAVMILEFIDGSAAPDGGDVISSVETGVVTTTDIENRVGVQGTEIPGGTVGFRFRLQKRGPDPGWAQAERLQFNGGTACCSYAVPQYAYPPESDDPYAYYVYDPDPNDPETDPNDNIALALDEHRRGGGNLVTSSRDERTISVQTGDVDGDNYPRITLADYGIEPGDILSIRGKAKRT